MDESCEFWKPISQSELRAWREELRPKISITPNRQDMRGLIALIDQLERGRRDMSPVEEAIERAYDKNR